MVEFLYPYSFLFLFAIIFLFFKNRVSDRLIFNKKLIADKGSIIFMKISLFLSFTFFVIALSRPVTDKKEIKENISIKKVAIALDISQSMLAEDVYPNRFIFAKHKIKQFIDIFKGEIAILVFHKDSFLVSPYTDNKEVLKYMIDNIKSSYISSNGTDFQNLIDTAKKMKYNKLIIFTDGGEIDKIDSKNLDIYLVLIGNKKSPIKLKNGNFLTKNGKIVMVGVNRKLLNYVNYGVEASNSDNDMKNLADKQFETIKTDKSIFIYKELFIYPLMLGIIFLFFAFFSFPKLKERN